jgi:sensor histidine kinase YesM
MVLQPIVENCINHGVRDIEREKYIYLSIYEEDGYVCINIGDNGVGIEQSVIDNLLSGKGENIEDEANAVIKETDSAYEKVKKEDKKGNGLGLRNVIERLDLYFNGKSKFEIYSNGKDQGTEFVIRIPGEDKVDE